MIFRMDGTGRTGRICLTLLLVAFGAIGCTGLRSRNAVRLMEGESVVLMAEEPSNLAFVPLASKSFKARSTYRDNLPATIHFEVGRDYLVNEEGQIRRTPNSRILDFKTNMLYGQEDFNHGKFPGFGNTRFFVYCDYSYQEPKTKPLAQERETPDKSGAGTGLPGTREKLRAAGKLRILAFGDSITAGGEASDPSLIYWNRWAESLRRKFPQASVEAINAATGGDTTVQGLQRLQDKVLSQRPDLVLLAFGMNDHNREGFGVPLGAFRTNLIIMIERIREKTSAEIALVSAFPPNPKWHFGSHNMEAYAEMTKKVAAETHCAFADVYHLWTRIAVRKKPEDLLGNNINHPNDFGHEIYFRALEEMGL